MGGYGWIGVYRVKFGCFEIPGQNLYYCNRVCYLAFYTYPASCTPNGKLRTHLQNKRTFYVLDDRTENRHININYISQCVVTKY